MFHTASVSPCISLNAEARYVRLVLRVYGSQTLKKLVRPPRARHGRRERPPGQSRSGLGRSRWPRPPESRARAAARLSGWQPLREELASCSACAQQAEDVQHSRTGHALMLRVNSNTHHTSLSVAIDLEHQRMTCMRMLLKVFWFCFATTTRLCDANGDHEVRVGSRRCHRGGVRG